MTARRARRDGADRWRGWTRCWAALGMTMFLALAAAVTPGIAQAASDPSKAPVGENASLLTVELSHMSPAVVTADGGNQLHLSGTVTNTGTVPIDDPVYRFQRGKPLTSGAAVRQEEKEPSQPTAAVTEPFQKLGDTIAPGASAPFSVSVPITANAGADTDRDSDTEPDSRDDTETDTGTDGDTDGGASSDATADTDSNGAESGSPAAPDPAGTLRIAKPGVYPLMLNVNGNLRAPGGPRPARVGELHVLLTVVSVPGGTSGPGGNTGTGPGAPITMLWPIVDRPHLAVDGVFANDDLAAEIAPGGRLAQVVDTLAESNTAPDAVTIVIDPMLLDELDRMSQGYRVLADPNTPQPALEAVSASSDGGGSATEPSAPTSGDPAARATERPTDASSSSGPSPATAAPRSMTQRSMTQRSMPSPSVTPPLMTPPSMTPPSMTGSSTPASSTGPATPAATSTGPSGTAPTTTGPATRTNSRAGTVPGTGRAAAESMLRTLRALAVRYEVLVLPYGDPDVVALARAGLDNQVAAAVYRGRAVASRVLQQSTRSGDLVPPLVTDVAVPPGGLLTDDAWSLLQSLGYDSAILSADGLAGQPDSTTGTATISGDESSGARPGTAAVAVRGAGLAGELTAALRTPPKETWPLRHDELTAELAMARQVGAAPALVLDPPRGWHPSRAGFAAVGSVLAGLSGAGVLRPMPARTLLDAIATGDRGVPAAAHSRLDYPDAGRAAELPGSYVARLASLKDRIAELGESLGTDPAGGPDPADILDPLAEVLLPAASAALRGASPPDLPGLHTVTATLHRLFNGVMIAGDNGTYTLASATAPLILTIQNSLPYQVTVRLNIVGGARAGLETTDPGRVVIGAGPRRARITIPSDVSRSGRFTVYAQLAGPQGKSWGPAVPIRVDSKAYGALTVTLMVVAGGVLLLMVAWRLVQRVRGRAGPRHDADGSGGATSGSGEAASP